MINCNWRQSTHVSVESEIKDSLVIEDESFLAGEDEATADRPTPEAIFSFSV